MLFEVVRGTTQQPSGIFQQRAAAALHGFFGGCGEVVGTQLNRPGLSVQDVELRGQEVPHVERKRCRKVLLDELGVYSSPKRLHSVRSPVRLLT